MRLLELFIVRDTEVSGAYLVSVRVRMTDAKSSYLPVRRFERLVEYDTWPVVFFVESPHLCQDIG